jgi:EmrB/QacA subfamily drug resistance transporter
MITLSLAFPFYTSYIALPRMMVALNANLDTIQWVLTAFTIAQTVMMPMVGWLSNRFGMRLFFSLCVLLTIVGSLGSGLAWNSGTLIACRILQGLGAGPIAPLSSVILFDAFPPGKRGVALGLSSSTWAIGALLALPLGGYLIEHLTWRAIFFCGMPCGLVGLGLSWRVLAPRSEAGEKRLDGWGVVTMVGFLVPLLFGLSQGQQYGWDTLSIRLSFVVAVVSAVMFVCSALYRAAPLLDLRLFANFPFAMACLVRFLNHVGFNAASLLLALFLQTTLDYSPLRAGLMVLPAALLVAPASLLIGRLTDRFDARLIFGSGLAVVTVAVYLLSTVTTWTPALWIVCLIMIQRLGSECVFAPLNYTGLQLLPAESMRMGSGVLALMWSVGGAIGNAATALMLSQRRVVHSMAIGQDYAVHPGEREHTLRELQASLQQAGSGPAELDLTPEDILRHYMDQETSVAAFQDCFLLTTGVYLLALLPALLVRPQRRDV